MSADPAAAAFGAALNADAGRAAAAAGPVAPAPPRMPDRDLDAPYGLGEDGKPNAPYGLKTDGRPRLKPGRPGQGATEKPRVVDHVAPPAAAAPSPSGPAAAAAGPDYTEDLMGLGVAVWLGLSSLRGGKLGPVRFPDTRPYAAVWHQELPRQVTAWNRAAQQSPAVRGYVEAFTGEGSKTWMIGVGIAAAGLVGACVELHRADQGTRDKYTEINESAMRQFMGETARLAEVPAA